jgi:hypothetical protein
MPQHRIIIPSGCAESACPKDEAHLLGLSAHLVIMEIFCFFCCCRHHLGLVRRQEFSLQPTHEFNLAITRCAGNAPTNQVDAPKALVLSIRRIHLPGRRISKGENYWLFCLVLELGVRLTSWVLPPTITSSRTSIPRCPGVASLYRVDAPKAPFLSILRIHLASRRISKCKHYSLFYV